jgi:tripartite-type tricarboxylate transporter receptor subunit TctC
VVGTILSALVMVLAPASAAWADAYPSRPVTLVSPFTPGSGSDLTARALAPFLKDTLGQSVIVENRPGAGGALGARQVAKAQPDGYTLLLGSVSFSTLPAVKDAGYDPVGDYETVALLGVQQMALLATPSLDATAIADIVKLAKAKPGDLNYGSAGVGSIGQLQMELLKLKTGADIVHIPYSGTPQVLSELVTGRVQMGIVAVPTALSFIKAGKVKALAVEGERRAPELPDVPTMDEAGFPELRDGVWYIIMAPKGTPKPVIAKLNQALRQALANPAAVEALHRVGIVPSGGSTPGQAASYLKEQVAKWIKVVKDANIQPVPTK